MNNMLTLLTELASAFVGMALISMLALGLFEKRKSLSPVLKAGLLALNYLLTNVAIYGYKNIFAYSKVIELAINICSVIALFLVLCNIKVYWDVFFGVCTLLFMESMGLVVSAIVVLTAPQTLEPSISFGARLLAQMFLYLSIFFVFRFVIWARKKASEKTQHKLGMALLGFSIVTFIVMLYSDFSPTVKIYFTEYVIGFSIIFILFIGITFFILIKSIAQHSANEKQLGIAHAQLELQKEHIAQMAEKQAKIAQMSHDFKQHIHTLIGLCETGNLADISEVLGGLAQQSLATAHIVSTGNATLDAILSIKREIAERDGVLCDWQIVIPPKISIRELDVCAVLGNALDNAIEACRRCHTAQPFIKLDLYCEDDWLLCTITNPIGQKPQREGEYFKTAKPDYIQHGLGIQSMTHFCEEMGGNFEVFYDAEKFTVRFILPLNI